MNLIDHPLPCIAYFAKANEYNMIDDLVLRGYYFPSDLAEGAELITVWDKGLSQGVSMPMAVLQWLVVVK